MSQNKIIGYLILIALVIIILWVVRHLPNVIGFASNLLGFILAVAVIAGIGYLLFRLLR